MAQERGLDLDDEDEDEEDEEDDEEEDEDMTEDVWEHKKMLEKVNLETLTISFLLTIDLKTHYFTSLTTYGNKKNCD